MKRMKRSIARICLVLALSLMLAPVAVAAENYEKARDSVVRVYATIELNMYVNGSPYQTGTLVSTGTGIAVGKKGAPVSTFVTNKHVVEVSLQDFQEYFTVSGNSATSKANNSEGEGGPEDGPEGGPEDGPEGDGEIDGGNGDNSASGTDAQNATASQKNEITYDAQVKAYIVFEDLSTMVPVSRTIKSDKYDLACLYIATPTDKRTPATFGLYNTSGYDLKDKPVVAYGFDGLSDMIKSGKSTPDSLPSAPKDATPTHGNVQHLAENDNFGSIIQHSAEINSGNSGGPLVWSNGMVIGVNTWGLASGVNQANIAQTTRQLKQFLDSENIDAEYAQIGILPIATIAIIAAAVLLIAAIILFGLVSGRKKKNSVPIVDPKGTRSLVVASGSLKEGNSYSLVPGKMFMIGTDTAKCNLVYPKGTPGVSRVHCSITFDGKTVIVKDENSSYGVFIDDRRLEKNKPTIMHRGHKLSLGSQKESLMLR